MEIQISLNAQQAALILVEMEHILKEEFRSETTKAIARLIINKINEK